MCREYDVTLMCIANERGASNLPDALTAVPGPLMACLQQLIVNG